MKEFEQSQFSSIEDKSRELLLAPKNLESLSKEWNIPTEDILLISINASGVKCGEVVNDRGRFVATFPSGRKYFLALTLTDKPFSPFEYSGDNLKFDDEIVAQTSEVEKDTCTNSYWRGGKKHLTLNSNSRSNCRGCAFCGTYSLADDDKALTTKGSLTRKFENLQNESEKSFSEIESVGVVTGCFPGEKELMDHLLMIRETLTEFGFSGELRYIGSQLRSEESLKRILDTGAFGLYLTVESFERREFLMKKTKASLDLESGKKLLEKAKTLGAYTCFLYIAGLDGHKSMEEQFSTYRESLTRLPQIQTFQAYVPEQIQLRNPEAAKVEYFLKTRKIVEEAYPDLLPIAANNFRGLWYTTYGETQLPNAEI